MSIYVLDSHENVTYGIKADGNPGKQRLELCHEYLKESRQKLLGK